MQALPNATLDVAGDLANTGMVLVNDGTVVVAGSVTGTGRLGLEGSELVLDGGVAAGQTIAFYNFGTTSTIDLSQADAIHGTLVGFTSNDTIIVEGTTLTAVDYTKTATNLGTLALMNDTTIVGVLTLAGTYSASDFGLTNADDGSNSVVSTTVAPGPVFSQAVASAVTPNIVDFGIHHVGDAVSQTLTIANAGPVGSSTENLDVSFSDTTGAGTASGSITGLAGGDTDSSSLSVGLFSTHDGSQSGTAVLGPSSDGNGVDGFGLTPLDPQTVVVSGLFYNFATASVAPVEFGNHHIGDVLRQNLSVTNSSASEGYSENLNASLGGATGAASGSGSITDLTPSAIDNTSLTIGVDTNADGVRTGNVVLSSQSDGTGIDGLGITDLTAQTIAATGTIYNYASAGLVSDTISLGSNHVGDVIARTVPISNAAPADGFSEKLDANLVAASGDLTASGTVNGLDAGVVNIGSLQLGFSNTADGVHGGTAVLSLISDGTGIDGLGTTDLTSQTITATGTLFNYATASAVTPSAVDFSARHVGDSLSQTLSIGNIGTADGFTENLDASVGGATGAVIANSSFSGLAAGQTDSSSLNVGLAGTHDGVLGGMATITLDSDGAGVDGLGSTLLMGQTVTVVGTLYNYATAGIAGIVDLGKHHVGDTPSQALSITNIGTADGYTERLDAAIGSTTGAVSAVGSVVSLAAGATDSSSVTLGLTGTQDGVHAGDLVLTLQSDGTGIDGLGTTVLTAQTIAATGTLYNYATANAIDAVDFGNHHVGDVVSHALSVSNIGAADGFTDNLDATVGGAAGAVTTSGTLVGLAAGATNSGSLVLGLASSADGTQSGSAVVSLVSDGADVDGLGTHVLTAQTIAAVGTLYSYATASVAAPSIVNFGAHHVGDVLSQTLSISNVGTADGFTEKLDASIGGATGSATGSGAFTGLTAGASNSGTLTVGLATTHDGVQTGAATLTLRSDGTGIDGLGTTVLTAQTIAATGTLYNLATASVANVINLGAHHVGDAISSGVTIANVGPVDAFTEELDASLGGASAGAFANGSFVDLAAGRSNSTLLSIGLSSTTEGNHSGTATLTLASDGGFVDGLGKTALVAQMVTATAAVYSYAAPIESTTTLDFGAMRIGGATTTRTLTISNGATADAFRENLGYALQSAPNGFGLITASSGSVAAGAAGANVTFSAGATAGNFNSTDTLTLTSLGAGTSGLANTTLTAQAITLKAKEYAPAVAKIQFTTINFGVEHVGDLVTIGDAISNIGTGALVDSLIGGVGTISSSQFISVGNLGTGVVPGPTSAAIGFELKTNATGVFSATASLALSSHDADLADVSVVAGPITLIGTVDNYATAALEKVSGSGTFSNVGNAYTLDLGTVAAGGTASVQLGVLNTASGTADALSGNFEVSGSGAFINSGTVAFSGLGAGLADTAPTVSLSTNNTGTFTETITLFGTGSNSSGYSGTLAPEELTVIGTVVSASRDLVWTGAAGTDFGTAANWDDTTHGLDPALSGPTAIDTADFSGIGGGITGAGSVAALSFHGGGAWHVASGATVAATGSVVVGSNTAGVLLIDGASHVVDGGGAQIAAQADASGSSVNVTGAGSDWQISGALVVGDAAFGLLNVSAGAAVSATTLEIAEQTNSGGDLTLNGTNSSVTTTGSLSAGDSSSGELSILNGASLSIGGDLDLGQGAGGSGNLDIEGNSTLYIGGNLNMGAGGPAVLTMGPGATVFLDNGGINATPNATIVQFVGFDPTQQTGGNISVAGNHTVTDTFTEYVKGVSVSTGTSGTLILDTPDVLNNGGTATTFSIGSTGGELILNADTVASGTAISFSDNTGTLVVGTDNVATIYNGTTSVPNPNQGLRTIGGFAATISGFLAGDSIEVQTAAAATFSQIGSSATIAVVENSTTIGTLAFLTAAQASTAVGTAGALVDVACFAAGTRIRTTRGEVKVEELREGDAAFTAIDGREASIIWIGHRAVDCKRHPRPETVWPVRISAGAFGRNLPKRVLTLSPDHAVYVNEVLVPVKHLVNGTTIRQVKVDRVTYYHVELERHDVIYAENLPAESYLDVWDRGNFANGGAVVRLHMDLAHHWEVGGCAPLVVYGPELEGVKRVVAEAAPKATRRRRA
jgi:T5SS/PEP-CTERM-associated repeat protein